MSVANKCQRPGCPNPIRKTTGESKSKHAKRKYCSTKCQYAESARKHWNAPKETA